MYPTLSLCIDGQFIEAGSRPSLDVHNPATFDRLGDLPCAKAQDIDTAIAAAERAFAQWRHVSPMDRSAVLRKTAELLRARVDPIAHGITLDNGKPLADARAEVLNSAEHVEWHAEECRRIYGRVVPSRDPRVRQLVIREPVGVCAAFSPWNFPLGQAIKKVSAAIGAGCTLVLKGPEESPSAIVAMAHAFHDAGLPAGVFNVVFGQPAEISRRLIESPVVRQVSFTGSVPVGKQLAALAGQHMKRVCMELGGHSPVLVFDDADVDAAAVLVARMKTRNAGQVCVSPSRLFVQAGVYDRFVERFVDAIESIQVGNGLEPNSQMGPLIHDRRLQAVRELVDDATRSGGRLLTGGARLGDAGHFFSPTVIADVPAHARIMSEEPFGPVASVVKFDSTELALCMANSVPYGLASYVFTESHKTATQVMNGLEVGMVNINHSGMAHPELPFGGVKDSGIGSEGGTETFDGFLITKMVTQI